MSEKMNFLFIFTDEQRKDHLSCYNDNMVLQTPNIDKIAKEGIKFTNFYCNNPICMPNRSTIYTGQYPSVHGVTTNGRNLPKGTNTFVDLLRTNGYHTASFGKIHLNYFGASKKRFDENLKSQEFAYPKYYKKLSKESIYFGLEEFKIVSGHGILCGHPDFLNWVVSKVNLDENLQLRLGIEPEDTDSDILRKYAKLMTPKQNGSFIKLQVWNHDIPEELYSTTFVKEHIIEYLIKFNEGKVSKENFFLFCSFGDPHHPFSPPGKYFDMFKPEEIILPSSFYDNHEKSTILNKRHYSKLVNTEGTIRGFFPKAKDLTELDAERVIAASYGMEKMIDDAVGEILDVLERTGLSENTIVIYTTDHGDLGGEHKFFFKGPFLYQGLINIPFIVKIPGGAKNKVCPSLVSSIDIPETILELAGLPIPEFMQGKSIFPILRNPDEKINDNILIEMDDEYINEKTRTLITDEWRITIFREYGELFNLKEDPDELNNLWDDESLKNIKLELILKLMRKNLGVAESRVKRDCQY
ncbi:MAG: sulfatase [Promethearchaeota archaeon]